VHQPDAQTRCGSRLTPQRAQVMHPTFGVGGRIGVMTKRRWFLSALGAGCAVVVLALAWFVFVYSSPLKVTVRNDTSAPISGIALVSGHADRTSVPDVAAGESVTVQPRVGPSEDHLTMVDARGRVYYLLGYFENNPGGRVTITLTGASDQGLAGRVEDKTHYDPWGESTLSPTAE
jgi:hypothetical protein